MMSTTRINSAFFHLQEDIPKVTDSIEGSLEHIQREPIQLALDVVAKMIGDEVAVAEIYGGLGKLYGENLDESDVLAVMKEMRKNGFIVVAQDDAANDSSSVKCLSVPDSTVQDLTRPIILINEKYSKATKEVERQIYFIVCMLLREIGQTLTPGLILRIYKDGCDNITPLKVEQKMLLDNKSTLDFSRALEEFAFGGRLGTNDNAAQPYRQALTLTLRPYHTVPSEPGNYAVYSLDDNYVKDKIAAVRWYLADKDAAFPGLKIPEGARSHYVEGHQAKSAKGAMRLESKGGALNSDSGSDFEQEVVDPEYEALVQCGIAFTRKQEIAMTKGYKI